MAKPVKKKSAFEKYIRKHYVIYYFGFIEALMFIAFFVELILFKIFGYNIETEYFPLSNKRLSLPFWQKCGTYMPGSEFPFPNLFCINDTNTFLNPFLRAVLFGIEMFAVTEGFIIGVVLLAAGIKVIKQRGKKDIGIDASARQKLKQMAVLFVFLTAILVVIFHFA